MFPLLLLPFLSLAVAIPQPQATGSATTPFFSAPNTFTVVPSGNTALPGSIISVTNSAGAGSYTDTFVYTAALSTVAPTGNVTLSPTGAAASANNLIPDPKNLQTAAAVRTTFTSLPLVIVGSIGAALVAGTVGGMALVL